eukprot:Em0022g107a
MLKELKCAVCSNILSQPLELLCGALKIRGIVNGEASALIEKEVLILSDEERRSLLDKAGISSSIELGQLRWLKSPGICLANFIDAAQAHALDQPVLKDIGCYGATQPLQYFGA